MKTDMSIKRIRLTTKFEADFCYKSFSIFSEKVKSCPLQATFFLKLWAKACNPNSNSTFFSPLSVIA